VVERLFAGLSRYSRLNTVFERKPDLFAAHAWISNEIIGVQVLAKHLQRLCTWDEGDPCIKIQVFQSIKVYVANSLFVSMV
jgi:hypothetical protein